MSRFALRRAALLAVLATAPAGSALAQPAAAPEVDAVCRSLETYAAQANPLMPQVVDAITEMTAITVDCAARTMTFAHRFTVPADQRPADLPERARRDFLTAMCDQGIATATGWTVVAEFYGPDGILLDTFPTTGADCAALGGGDRMGAEQLAVFVATAAASFQTQLPIRLGDSAEIVATRGDGPTLVYEVRLALDMAVATVETEDVLHARLVPALCGTSQMGILFRAGGGARVAVTDLAGRTLDIPLGANECAAALVALTTPVPPTAAPAVSAAASPVPAADCAALEAYAVETNRGLPQRADDVVETLEVRVDCAAATVTFQRRLLVAPADVPTGYFDQQLLRHRETHCGVNGLASRFAMTAIDEVRAADGALFTTLATTPADCDGFTAAMADAAAILTPAELDERLDAIAQTFLPHLPVQLNDSVVLTGVFHGTGVLVYFYRLTYAVPEAERPAMEAMMQGVVREQECADEETRLYLRSGASLTYRYTDAGNALLFSVTIAAAECGLH
ncbi:MAG: hypothetical protein IT534_12960 [Bauldia sp.]|nr:hypothetical protein [Bauldia sp.]